MSTRSISETLRVSLQRRIVVSICCREKIQSNMIRHDLSLKYPSARIERKAHLVDRSGNPKRQGLRARDDALEPSDIVDFIVFDHDKPKLVFEGCYEAEKKLSSPKSQAPVDDRQYVVINDGNEQRRVDVTYAEKFQACVKFDTGQVTYRQLTM